MIQVDLEFDRHSRLFINPNAPRGRLRHPFLDTLGMKSQGRRTSHKQRYSVHRGLRGGHFENVAPE